ncbi:MAG: hypothetical protein U1E63_01985 [Burkholderiales bacterium]
MAEDTRVTHKLLLHHGIHTRLIAAHELLQRAAPPHGSWRCCAMASKGTVTDAGVPGISIRERKSSCRAARALPGSP